MTGAPRIGPAESCDAVTHVTGGDSITQTPVYDSEKPEVWVGHELVRLRSPRLRTAPAAGHVRDGMPCTDRDAETRDQTPIAGQLPSGLVEAPTRPYVSAQAKQVRSVAAISILALGRNS